MDPDISFPEGWTAPLELTGALPRETSLSDEGSTTVRVATRKPVQKTRQKTRQPELCDFSGTASRERPKPTNSKKVLSSG